MLDQNKDGTYRIDHLNKKGLTDKQWCRPAGHDDIQDTEEIQILPVSIPGTWTFDDDVKPPYVVINIEKIKRIICLCWNTVESNDIPHFTQTVFV